LLLWVTELVTRYPILNDQITPARVFIIPMFIRIYTVGERETFLRIVLWNMIIIKAT